jgi:hypothetical protein
MPNKATRISLGILNFIMIIDAANVNNFWAK